WAIKAGVTQMNQTQNAQDQDRFDKAITRLGSSSASERLTGAAGLSLFLSADQQSRHGATLRFLATALVVEKEPTVRQAILDTFSHIDPAVVPNAAREEGLRTLLDLNRSEMSALSLQEHEDSNDLQRQDSPTMRHLNALGASGMA